MLSAAEQFKRTCVHTYTKSQVEWRNHLDRALPVMYTRYAEVFVYRLPCDFFGFFDKEYEVWDVWKETAVNWDGKESNGEASSSL
jgi:hypothetical protein